MQSGAPGTMVSYALYISMTLIDGLCALQQIRPLEKAYPAYSNILNFYGAGAATSTARMNALRALPAAELLKGPSTRRFVPSSLTISSQVIPSRTLSVESV